MQLFAFTNIDTKVPTDYDNDFKRKYVLRPATHIFIVLMK